MINYVNDIIKDQVFIIAEAGINHNGNLEMAKKLIDAAVEAEVNAVKFQTFSTDRLVTKNASKANYQKGITDKNEKQYDMLKKLELSLDDHKILKSYCNNKNIIFLSTPYDFKSVDLLEKLGVNLYKIASGDLTNIPLLKYIAEKQKPMIVSTGMSNLAEVEEAVMTVEETRDVELVLLHCVSNYPAKYENVNLKAMNTLKTAFNVNVGYSDHTPGIEVPIAAVTMGAKVIEKHFTLDKTMEGPDHRASLNPNELSRMVKSIRKIEESFGDGIKKCQKSEMSNKKVARKSFVAAKRLKKVERITENDIDIKRPGIGISPNFYHKIIGSISNKNIEKDELLKWKDLELEA